MSKAIDILLLLALPASGKSEVRRYLGSLSPNVVQDDFHLGATVQLDDYPYVHLMRRISQQLRELGRDGAFFDSDAEPMKEPLDWGTLIELLNEDYEDLHARPATAPESAAAWLFDRIDAARLRVGATPALGALDAPTRESLERALESEARQLWNNKIAEIPDSLSGKTVVMEFARGGAEGSTMPLAPPFGYAYSLSRLSDAILERATILYVWVTPEESRRKNDERSRPGREGDASILHHGVPNRVMREDYGTDDMAHLVETSDREGTVRVQTRGRSFHLPVARLDNRGDLTSFLRAEPEDWSEEDVRAIHEGLRAAFDSLARD